MSTNIRLYPVTALWITEFNDLSQWVIYCLYLKVHINHMINMFQQSTFTQTCDKYDDNIWYDENVFVSSVVREETIVGRTQAGQLTPAHVGKSSIFWQRVDFFFFEDVDVWTWHVAVSLWACVSCEIMKAACSGKSKYLTPGGREKIPHILTEVTRDVFCLFTDASLFTLVIFFFFFTFSTYESFANWLWGIKEKKWLCIRMFFPVYFCVQKWTQ